MKNVLMTAALIAVFFVPSAQANVFDFDVTGVRAEYYDYGTGQAYIPTTGRDLIDPLGGYIYKQSNSESYGFATQFTVGEAIHLESLNYDISIQPNYDRLNEQFQPQYLSFDWKIYDGSTNYHDENILVPDVQKVLSSGRQDLVNENLTGNYDKQYNDLLVSLGVYLQPGHDYWIAYELNGGPRANAYINDVHGITGPEPSTFLLLGVGLVGLIRRRMA